MSEKYSFFNAELVDGNYDRTYTAEDYAAYFASFVGNGVYATPATNLQVTANSTNMQITVAAGKAWINGYFYQNTDNLVFQLNNADGVLNRMDSIVVQLDLTNRKISTVVKTGVFASSPISPTITRTSDIYEIQLATVFVGAGVTKINQSDVYDSRQNSIACGYVSGAVEQIDTTNLFTQFTDSFNTWFNGIKSQLAGDIATNLQNQINTINNSKGTANGIATLDANGKLKSAQKPTYGVSDGLATLDSNGNVIQNPATAYLPLPATDDGTGNTHWCKYSDGTIHIWGQYTSSITVSGSYGSMYLYSAFNVTLPQSVTTYSTGHVNILSSGALQATGVNLKFGTSNIIVFNIVSPVTVSSLPITIQYSVWGKWK